jgi:hypothetical protein
VPLLLLACNSTTTNKLAQRKHAAMLSGAVSQHTGLYVASTVCNAYTALSPLLLLLLLLLLLCYQ